MKSTFLLVAAPISAGMPKLNLRNVDSGEGLNDFRSGSQNGVTLLDVFATDFEPEIGVTYLLTLDKYVEPTDTAGENSDTLVGSTIAQITGTVPAQSQSFTFNDQLSVVIENGVATLQIFGQALTAPLDTESEEQGNTQVQGGSVTSDINQSIDAENNTSGDQSINNIIPIGGNVIQDEPSTDKNTDPNTQVNAGPAAGAESSENSGPVVDNTNNPAV